MESKPTPERVVTYVSSAVLDQITEVADTSISNPGEIAAALRILIGFGLERWAELSPVEREQAELSHLKTELAEARR